jgi:hypothetical protein
MPRLMFFLIDYDGCADNHLNVLSIQHKMRNALEADPEVHIVLLTFSARQSIQLNELNKQRNNNGCCFTSIYQFTQEFKTRHPQFAERVSLEPWLLEDLQQNKDSGTHFRQALQKVAQKKRNSPTTPQTPKESEYTKRFLYLDEHKVTLLFCQTHHVLKKYATLTGNQPITFAIFDNTLSILSRLLIFYSKNSNYLPNNVGVKLYHCYINPITKNSDTEKLGELKGTALQQGDFIATIPEVYELACANQKTHNSLISSLKLLPTSKTSDILKSLLNLINESSWLFTYYLVKRLAPKEQDQCIYNSILLIAGVLNHHTLLVEQLLNKKNINLALTINDNGQEKTAIEIAAALNFWDIVDFLSQTQSPPGDKLHYGSVIFWALQKKQDIIAKKLLLNMNPADRYRYPLMSWAIQTQSYEFLTKILAAYFTPSSNIALHQAEIIETIQYANTLKDNQAQLLLYPYVIDPLPLLEKAIITRDLNTYNLICQTSQTNLSSYSEQPSMIAKISSTFSQLLIHIDVLSQQKVKPKIQLPSKSSNSDSDYIETTDESQGESESPRSPQAISPHALPIEQQNIIQQFIDTYIGSDELLLQQVQLIINHYYTTVHGTSQLTRMTFIELTKLILPHLQTKSTLAKFYRLVLPISNVLLNQDELRTLYILPQGDKPEQFSATVTAEQFFLETLILYLLRGTCSPEQKSIIKSMNRITNIREAYLSYRLVMQGGLKIEPIIGSDLINFIQNYFSNYLSKENPPIHFAQLVMREPIATIDNPLLNKIIRVINKVSGDYPINHPIHFAIYALKLRIAEQEPRSPDAIKSLITNWAGSINPWIPITNRQLCLDANTETTNAFCFFSSSSKPMTTILLEQCNKEIAATKSITRMDGLTITDIDQLCPERQLV